MSKSAALPEKWLKASVIGTIWAAIEIIAGSFLHNLRIPFAGTFLSMFSVFMLVAFMRQWKEPGIIIRAGIVAALMKSLSPSAVIFGPMVAIFMEGLILETVTLVFRRNLVSYLIAGGLAVMWALVQKLVNFLIIYGFDLVRIAEAFYHWLVVKTGLEHLPPSYLWILIFGIYALAGALAALAGYISVKNMTDVNRKGSAMPPRIRSERLNLNDFNNYGAFHILLIISSVVSLLLLLEKAPIWLSIPSGTIFLVYIFLRYKRALRYIKKPGVWIQFLLLTLLATLLWEWVSSGEYFSVAGLEVGLKMIFRALIIIFAFSSLSVEFRNPLVKTILQKNGFKNLYLALNLSFTALPLIADNLPQIKHLFRKRREVIHTLLSQSNYLLNELREEIRTRDNIYILSGPTQSGKTTILTHLLSDLKSHGVECGGFIAPGTFKNDERHEIYLREAGSGKSYLLASKEKHEGWIQNMRFYFDKTTVEKGNEILVQAMEDDVQLLILDELGPIEMKGKGWYPSLIRLIERRDIIQLWIVREKLLHEVKINYMIPDSNVFTIGETQDDEILKTLVSRIETLRS